MAVRTDELVPWFKMAVSAYERGKPITTIPDLLVLLYKSLGPQERHIFTVVTLHTQTTTAVIAEETGLPLNHIGTVLGRLRAYGLLESTEMSHETGGIYNLWSVSEWLAPYIDSAETPA